MIKRIALALVLVAVSCSQGEEADPVAVARGHLELATSARGMVLEPRGYRLVEPDNLDTFGAWARVRAWAPSKPNDPMRIEAMDDPEISIELSSPRSEPRLADGAIVFEKIAPHTDALFVGSAGKLEELRVFHTGASTRAEWTFRLGAHVSEIRVKQNTLEVLDAKGRVRLASDPIVAFDATHLQRAASVRLVGSTVTVDVDPHGMTFPIVLDPSWSAVPSPMLGGAGITATALGADKVLAIVTEGASIYDATANTWTATASPTTARAFHTATALLDGKVLVVGGEGVSTAELFDPSTGKWSPAGTMAKVRSRHAAVQVADGRVLIVGGTDGTSGNQVAETWDPATKSFKTAGSFDKPRANGVAAALTPKGLVLVVCGGVTDAELWDPSTNVFHKTKNPLLFAHTGCSASTLSDGKIFIAAGNSNGQAEIYNEASDSFSFTGVLAKPRGFIPTVLLSGDRVLAVGGAQGSSAFVDAEGFDPRSTKFLGAGSMTTARANHAAAILSGDRVLVIGGNDLASKVTTAELFVPQASGSACTGGAECTSAACKDGQCCESCDPKLQCLRVGDCPTGFKCDTSAHLCLEEMKTPPPTTTPPVKNDNTSNSSGCDCTCQGVCRDQGCSKSWNSTFKCDCCKNCGIAPKVADPIGAIAWLAAPFVVLFRRRRRSGC